MKQNLIHTSKISSNNLQKIQSIIFARAISCLGIVVYHYFEHGKGNYKSYFRIANSNIGLMFVTVFLCISGTVHYYNYPRINSIKRYYYKRWKSILFPYYICIIYVYILIVTIAHKLIKIGSWKNIVFILFGLDGYLRYTYRLNVFNLEGIGEWFLGAIIIIYIFYPLLVLLMDINIFIINYIVCINYYLMYKTNIYRIIIYGNIFTCLNAFYFGMIVVKYKKFFLKNVIVFIISFLLLIFLFVYKISNTFFLINQIHGFSLYIFLLRIGEFIMSKKYSQIFHIISGLSYSIFLYHHWILRNILHIKNPIELSSHLKLLFITIIIIIFYAKIHCIIISYVMKSKIFEILDTIFLR